MSNLGAPVMRHGQRGVTFISFIVIAAFVASYAFAVLKITPFYLEQMKVSRILTDVETNLSGSSTTLAKIRSAINKRLDIEMVRGMNALDFKIKKSKNGYTVNAQYERRAAYFGNLSLVVSFDKSVEIKR
ncbi:MAG: DUF4845 domain-containing protein [Gammaproteobacteria bacterium]|nr:MAG: DUF4845 domain-containing protein [Gammaproteobacteria bacterium]